MLTTEATPPLKRYWIVREVILIWPRTMCLSRIERNALVRDDNKQQKRWSLRGTRRPILQTISYYCLGCKPGCHDRSIEPLSTSLTCNGWNERGYCDTASFLESLSSTHFVLQLSYNVSWICSSSGSVVLWCHHPGNKFRLSRIG